MTKTRPAFLEATHQNGATIVEAFRALPLTQAQEVDSWLLQAASYGSMTWQERQLYEWINESWDLEAAFEAAQ